MEHSIRIDPITKENEDILRLPNEPFFCEGRVVPMYDGKDWSYEIRMFEPEQVKTECFPDEHYQLDEMGEGFYGLAAYVDGQPAGYALLYSQWNKYLYLDNILVRSQYRRYGVGSRLLEESMKLAAGLEKLGVWLICQDNNLQAMRFYLANGFTLGGMNLPVYEGTGQEGKADLYLYKRL